LERVIENTDPMDSATQSKLNLALLLGNQIDSENGNRIESNILKLMADELLNKAVLYGNLNNATNSTIIGDKALSSHIYLSSSQQDSINVAIKDNFPVYNMTECEATLRKYYNITGDIVYAANNYDGILNKDNNTNSYTISVYDYETKKKLDLDLCMDDQIEVQLPLTNTSDLNLTFYKEMKNKGIDIFNPDDAAFNDICFIDTYNGTDTTINWRREHYLNQKIPMCVGVNCTYQGLTEDNYVTCKCSGLQGDSSLINTIVNYFLESLSDYNIWVIYCYKQIPTVSLFLLLVKLAEKLWLIYKHYFLYN
jgi:hypothetical protein